MGWERSGLQPLLDLIEVHVVAEPGDGDVQVRVHDHVPPVVVRVAGPGPVLPEPVPVTVEGSTGPCLARRLGRRAVRLGLAPKWVAS